MSIRITTQRLNIREYQEADFKGVHIYTKDPETVQFMTWGPNTPKKTEGFIQLAIAQQIINPRIKFHFAVELIETGQKIGGGGIHIRPKEGHFKQAVCRKGKWRDSLLYAILDSERFTPKISQ